MWLETRIAGRAIVSVNGDRKYWRVKYQAN